MTTDQRGTPIPETEADSVARIAREGVAPSLHEFSKIGVPVIVIAQKGEVRSLEHLLDNPRRARASVTVRDHASFIAYVEAHKGPGTVIFAEVNEQGGSFTAVIDFHVPHKTEESGEQEARPQWGDHVCKYVCEHTPEWKRWFALSGKMMSQVDFATFIEENRIDVKSPDGATMLELVKTLIATQAADFKSIIRLDNGDRDFAYSHTTAAKAGVTGNLTVPEKFTIGVPVFMNGPEYAVTCRFRYRVSDGRLTVGFEFERPHKIIDLALNEARTAIVQTTKLPVLLGSGSVTKA